MSGYIFGLEAPVICPIRPRADYIRMFRSGKVDSWIADLDDDIPLRCGFCSSISGSDFIRLVKARAAIHIFNDGHSATIQFNTGKPVTRTIIGDNKSSVRTGGIHALVFNLSHFTEVENREFRSLLGGGLVNAR